MEDLTVRLAALAPLARREFEGLSDEQFNWKPAADSWSIAQCLLHLVKTNKAYFPIYDRLASGSYAPNFWERRGWFGTFWKNFFVNGVDPKNVKKMKAPSSINPVQSHIDKSILDKLEEQNGKVTGYYDKLRGPELEQTIVSSPFATFIVYPAACTFDIIVLHEERHIQQALRVKDHPGFPK